MEGKFKIFVITAILVLAVAIAGSTFWILRSVNSKMAGQQADTSQTTTEVKTMEEVALGDAITTNIAMEDNVQHFIKVKISIGIDADDKKAYDALSAQITAKAASIRSEIIATLGEQTFTMLSNTATGKEKLSDELIGRLNKLLDTDLIKEVYYEEYFVQ